MNIKTFSLSAARVSPKHYEHDFGPSMVDPTVHNPTIQEILERYTKTGQLNCSVRQAFYDEDEEAFAPSEPFDDFTDILEPVDYENEPSTPPLGAGGVTPKGGEPTPASEELRTKDEVSHEVGAGSPPRPSERSEATA